MGRWEDIYGYDYFHGVNSNYSPEGYEKKHPNWDTYLDCIAATVSAGSRILDMGCAYGFFVQEARSRGYSAFGADVSMYALSRNRGLAAMLAAADVAALPFASRSFDLVTAFHLMANVSDPSAALQECKRVLRPTGFLLFCTPDPVKSTETYEKTHNNERPPSFWLKLLGELGFDCRYWFCDSLLEVIASPIPVKGKALDAIRDAFMVKRFPAIGMVKGSGGITMSPRGNWGQNAVGGGPRSLYLLNQSGEGLSCRLCLKGKGVEELNFCCSSPLATALREPGDPKSNLETDWAEWIVQLPPQGVELVLSGESAQGVQLQEASISEIHPWSPDFKLLAGDYLSRHRIVIDFLKKLDIPKRSRILDLGGGDSLIALLAPEWNWTVVDLYGVDHPSFLRRSFNDPFGDGRLFDAVVSVDVLEHIPPDLRNAFLERLCSLTAGPVILGAPFDTPLLQTVERIFAQGIAQISDGGNRFIEEHRKLGLPSVESIVEYLRRSKGKCVVLPGESILYWWQSTFHYMALKELSPSLASLVGRIQNETDDHRIGVPCYRQYVVAGPDLDTEAWEAESARTSKAEFNMEKLVAECLKMAAIGALFQTKKNAELRSALETAQANLEIVQANLGIVQANGQRFLEDHARTVAERDAFHSKYRRLRDFLVTLYQVRPVKWFMPLGPIDPKTGEFRLK